MNIENCSYCSFQIDDIKYLHCTSCKNYVHIECLKNASTPGDLLGDVFFNLICKYCVNAEQQQLAQANATNNLIINTNKNNNNNNDNPSTISGEYLIRQHMSWLLVVTLTLYNLSIKCKGLSHHGFFHWRTHIANFIDKNWDYLFNKNVRRKKNWFGSVSGTLSHNCPTFFISGQEILKESGWWKLTHAGKTPTEIMKMYQDSLSGRQDKSSDKRQRSDETSDNETPYKKRYTKYASDDQSDEITSCSRALPYMGCRPRLLKRLINNNNITTAKTATTAPTATSTAAATAATSPIMSTDLPLITNSNDSEIAALNPVQSSLMDFLAESLASDDLSMFNEITSLPPEPLISPSLSCRAIDHTLSLLENDDNANFVDHNIQDLQQLEMNDDDLSVYSNYASTQTINTKTATTTFDESQKQQQQQPQQEIKANFPSSNYHGDENNQQQQHHQIQTANGNTDIEADEDDNNETDEVADIEGDDDDDYDESCQPRIVQVINFQQLSSSKSPGTHDNKIQYNHNNNNITNEVAADIRENIKVEKVENEEKQTLKHSWKDDDEESTVKMLASCKPSLFTKYPRRPLPWLIEQKSTESEDSSDSDIKEDVDPNDFRMMNEDEENELLRKLRKIFKYEEKYQLKIPAYVRRFYRKLCIRAWKRERGKPLFNIDSYDNQGQHLDDKLSEQRNTNRNTPKLLNRYQLISLSSGYDVKKSFYARIAGSFEYELFESPYTQRILHPFIYRNKKCFPLFLKLMCELKYKVNGIPPSRAPIDFCYVRPNHIAAVNALLQHIFWPGIDMSECLSYPDFSVVALYKKLIIGCGFLVPDVGFNEAYISFMAVRPGWQRNGIATFMLYHLIQTCMTKDITLHVSATNPAVMLYQKFGFKIEEIILNFYDDYLPKDSKHSRHAFFLRLMR